MKIETTSTTDTKIQCGKYAANIRTKDAGGSVHIDLIDKRVPDDTSRSDRQAAILTFRRMTKEDFVELSDFLNHVVGSR